MYEQENTFPTFTLLSVLQYLLLICFSYFLVSISFDSLSFFVFYLYSRYISPHVSISYRPGLLNVCTPLLFLWRELLPYYSHPTDP